LEVIKKDLKHGMITLKITTLDDLWHLYNIILPGDFVTSKTVRRIKSSDEDGKPDKGSRKPMTLKIQVDDVSFHAFSNRLRIKGKIVSGPEDLISIGTFHTLNIEIGSILTIEKDEWPRYLLERIEQSSKYSSKPMVLIVTIDDGIADLIVVSEYALRTVLSISRSITGKRGELKDRESAIEEFFKELLQGIKQVLKNYKIDLIVVAGPGFTKEHFVEFLKQNKHNFPQIIMDFVSNVGIPGAKEVLSRGIISQAVEGLRIERETQLLDELLMHIGKEDGKAAYGTEYVMRAAQIGAVSVLLLIDKLLRTNDPDKRRFFDELIKLVESSAGDVVIMSTEHPSGKQLEALSGVAAILRFPIE